MFDVPTTLSPSRVDAFTNCPMAFRFSSIEKLPEPPGVATTRGSLVHRALELLFTAPAPERTAERLEQSLDTALAEYRSHPDFTGLRLGAEEIERFEHECRVLTDNYLQMEDPTEVREIGLELELAAPVGDLTLRGIIDRLELDQHGGLIVTDYKTGRAPSAQFEQKSLGGVHFYAFLCDQVFGQRPTAVRLMYLKTGETITATPTAQSVKFLTTRTRAVWKAVERACVTGEFRPRQSALCRSCSFQRWCPEFGGDPDRAATETAEAQRLATV